jgi:hypothetical protein
VLKGGLKTEYEYHMKFLPRSRDLMHYITYITTRNLSVFGDLSCQLLWFVLRSALDVPSELGNAITVPILEGSA